MVVQPFTFIFEKIYTVIMLYGHYKFYLLEETKGSHLFS